MQDLVSLVYGPDMERWHKTHHHRDNARAAIVSLSRLGHVLGHLSDSVSVGYDRIGSRSIPLLGSVDVLYVTGHGILSPSGPKLLFGTIDDLPSSRLLVVDTCYSREVADGIDADVKITLSPPGSPSYGSSFGIAFFEQLTRFSDAGIENAFAYASRAAPDGNEPLLSTAHEPTLL